MNAWSTQKKITIGTAVGVTTAALLSWLLWPSAEPAPRERQYQATTACLLTDDKGVTGEPASTVWAGMQEASLASHIKVQYLAVHGPQTMANALTYFNTLGVQNCTMILAAGPTPVDAMVHGHAQFPDIAHVAVGGDATDPKITAIPSVPGAQIRPEVTKVVSTAG